MFSALRRKVRQAVRARGYDIVRLSPDPLARVVALLGRCGSSVVLDVGGNRGQYYHRLRRAGFEGRVVSFEPNPEMFVELKAACGGDPRWRGLCVGLGGHDGDASLIVTANPEFASFHGGREGGAAIDAGIAARGAITVKLRTLEGLWDDLDLADAQPFLKLDVQGSEREVLDGTGHRVSALAGVQVEVAFAPMYVGQPTAGEMLGYLADRGFDVHGIFEGMRDQASGALIEADIVFLNRRRRTDP